jgi:hypothetical protein
MLSLLVGCGGETGLGAVATPPDLPGTPTPTDPVSEPPDGPSPLRDTDGDGIPDDQDPDIDGDGLDNAEDPDPDGDGQPGFTLPYDPNDDPAIDPGTGLPVLEVGSARGRICAPNGTTWVSGANVTILTPSGGYEATSNGDGWWQIDGLPPGEYGVVITKGSFYLTYNIVIEDGVVTEQVFDECLVQGDLSIAAVVGEWDHVEDVLESLGLNVTEYNGNTWGQGIPANVAQQRHQTVTELLTNPAHIGQYDVVFLNCGISEQWASTNQALVAQTLRDYVEAGGSIYASDWSHYVIESAFPDKITFHGNDAQITSARVGNQASVSGVVVDPAMSTLLGSNTASIAYDAPQWVTMQSVDPTVDVLVEGTFPFGGDANLTGSGPLSVRFTAGQGRVIYTTFHNEGAATTPDMHDMLEEIALSL